MRPDALKVGDRINWRGELAVVYEVRSVLDGCGPMPVRGVGLSVVIRLWPAGGDVQSVRLVWPAVRPENKRLGPDQLWAATEASFGAPGEQTVERWKGGA